MALLRSTAEQFSQEDLEGRVVQEIITEDDVFNVLDFVTIEGKSLVFNRENALPTVDWVDVNETITESSATFTEVTSKLYALVGDVHVDGFLQVTTSDRVDQMALQVTQKSKALGRTFRDVVVNGDNTTNPKQPDGLRNMVTAGQTVGANNDHADGGDFTLEDMDRLVDKVKSGPVNAIIMHERSMRRYRTLLRAGGGVDAAMVQLANFGRPVLTFGHRESIPVIVNNYLPTNLTKGAGTNQTVMFAVNFGQMTGVTGLVPSRQAGIVTEFLGVLQDKDAEGLRLKWYVGLTLWSTLGLSMMNGINN